MAARRCWHWLSAWEWYWPSRAGAAAWGATNYDRASAAADEAPGEAGGRRPGGTSLPGSGDGAGALAARCRGGAGARSAGFRLPGPAGDPDPPYRRWLPSRPYPEQAPRRLCSGSWLSAVPAPDRRAAAAGSAGLRRLSIGGALDGRPATSDPHAAA